ncbi:MAG: amidase [Azospirillaceae bacterium]
MSPFDPAAATVASLAAALEAGSLTAEGLTAACLERIAAEDEALHAFVHVAAEPALATARALDALRAAGTVLGPLQGIPVALKDLIDVAGQPSGYGSASADPILPARSASLARSLVNAGMILIGKTHMTEYAYGSWGTNRHRGTPWNPVDRQVHRVPGGSSSGSAVAVAGGLVPAAIGTDSGGSVRIPAALCGLVGYKPVRGTIPLDGVLALSPSMDVAGPICRSVADAALVLDALRGRPARPRPGPRAADLEGLRVGTLAAAELEAMDAAVVAAYRAALGRLAEAGAYVREAPLPGPFTEAAASVGTILSVESFAIHRDRLEAAGRAMDPAVLARIRAGGEVAAADYHALLLEREADMARFDPVFADIDVLVTPTVTAPAAPVAEVDEAASPMSRISRVSNWLDLPSLALPCGRTGGGLPLSLQIVGPRDGEARVLRTGVAVEACLAAPEPAP